MLEPVQHSRSFHPAQHYKIGPCVELERLQMEESGASLAAPCRQRKMLPPIQDACVDVLTISATSSGKPGPRKTDNSVEGVVIRP